MTPTGASILQDRTIRFTASAGAVILVDQITKYLVRSGIALHDRIELIPHFLALTYVQNTGAAWGILGGWNGILAAFSLAVLGIIYAFRHRLAHEAGIVVLGIITGGIVGNLLDRLRLGWVTDMIDLHVFQYHWPAFNVADAAICLGVMYYVVRNLRAASGSRKNPDHASPSAR
ncbi:MAG TPA: signal peptidase II [Lentisphaerae bacterium]|nr:signal peptidase II [Lentisphaerota bacterium]